MRKSWSLLSAILCILWSNLYIGRGQGNGDGCYTRNGDCCIECKPGYLLYRKCGPCKPCPSYGYMDRPNAEPSCIGCRKCEGILEYKSSCSATKNAVCKCIAGKKCADKKCTQCEDNPCPAGTQLTGEDCVKCPLGTFNSGSESTCQPWKNCSATGAVLYVTGTSTSDVVCLPKPTKIPPTTLSITSMATKKPEVLSYDLSIIIVAVSVVFIIIVSIVLFLCLSFRLEMIKNKFQKIKHTEQEDACSCHYPEEEHGGEEETLSTEP